ncbi:M56 family metallopeptidase [Singulisphaera sp. Ch08]|uniref:M56 family metallopeptidase n=1 Tax=Singulisphaera sp. Ch08 TaxID=3120278 RepID=A0AAU7CJ86_9BACT
MNLLGRIDPGDPVVRTALATLLQATAVILVAALVAGTALRRRAAARHNLWLVALVWILLSPAVAPLIDGVVPTLAVVILPDPSQRTIATANTAVAIGGPKPGRGAPAAKPALAPSDSPAGADPAESTQEPTKATAEGATSPGADLVLSAPGGAEPVANRRSNNVVGGLFVLWAAGLLIRLGRIVAGACQVSALTRSARELDPARYHATLASAREALGVVTLPPILTSARAVGPVALGLLRPRIVLPEGLAESVTAAVLRDVLVHEGAHALRRDPWVGLLQRLAAALFWPHPLVHYLNGQLTRAREEVCDNHVLRCDDACSYARALLALTERYHPFRESRAGLGLLWGRWTLADRVAGLLDPGRVQVTRTTVGARIALAAALAATGVAAASIRFAPPARAVEPGASNPVAVTVAVAATAPARPRAGVWWLEGVVVDEQGQPVAGAIVRPPAAADRTGVSGGTTADDGTFTLTLSGRHRNLYGLVAETKGGERVGLTPGDAPLTYLTRNPIRIVLKPTRPLTVRVKDRDGAPIAGAAVEAVEYGYQTQGETGPDGTAMLRVAADARIRWVIGQKTGDGFDYFENYQPTRPSEYPPLPPELSLTLDGALPLRIKAVDSEGRPLAGVKMSPSLIQRTAKVAPVTAAFAATSWVTTDASGVAVFDRFPKDVGGCGFDVRSEAHLCLRSPTSERDGPTDLTVRLLRRTRLSGTVRFPDGRPAPNIHVRVEGTLPHTSGADSLARTGDDGTYALEVRPESVYIVAVEDETWAARSRTGIIVREDQPQAGLDFTLGRGTLLQGQVTEGADPSKPAAGANLALVEEGPLLPKGFRLGVRNERLTRLTAADPQGRYRFRVGPGQYTLRVGAAASLKFEVKDEPEVVRNLPLKTSPNRTYFTVVVVEKSPEGDRTVPRAAVARLVEGGGRIGPTPADDQGRIRLVRQPGNLLYVRGDGGRLSGLTPVPETAETVTVAVAPAARISGRVVDTDGKPQARKRVVVLLNFDSDFARSHRYEEVARTDEQGRFSYQGVPAGTRGEVSAFHEKDGRTTGARTVVPFRVDEPDQVEVPDLVVPPSGPANEPVRVGSVGVKVTE